AAGRPDRQAGALAADDGEDRTDRGSAVCRAGARPLADRDDEEDQPSAAGGDAFDCRCAEEGRERRMTEKRVAFVTGGSRGIGAAIAKRLAKDGLHVVAVARSADKLQQVVDEIKSEGGSAEPLVVDIADGKALADAIEKVTDAHGRLDVL